MKRTCYRIESLFGPVGSFAGIIVFIAGVVLVFYSFGGFLLMGIGAFVGFSFSGTCLDVTNKRVRFSHTIFGILPTGRWIAIEPGMQLGIVRKSTVWRTYSWSNRAIDVAKKSVQIVLFDQSNRPLMPIRTFHLKEQAEIELAGLCLQLGILPLQAR